MKASLSHWSRRLENLFRVKRFLNKMPEITDLTERKKPTSYPWISLGFNRTRVLWERFLRISVISVSKEQSFKDKCFLYRFWQDEEGSTVLPLAEDVSTAEDQLLEHLGTLINRGPDAYLRMILRKQ